MFDVLKAMPSKTTKLFEILPGKLKKSQDNILAYIASANTYIEIARFTDDGVLIAEKWIDEPVGIVENIGEVIYKQTDNAERKTAKLNLVKDKNGSVGLSNVLSLIRQLITRPTYKSSRIIYSSQNKTITLIGKWSEKVDGVENGLKKVFDELSETDLNIYMQSGKFDNKGGFNMLSIEGWSTKVVQEASNKGIELGTKAFDDYIWETYNKPWLESAMQRGDDVILWSDPNNIPSKEFTDGIGKTFYGREVDFFKNNSSKYGYDYSEGIKIGSFLK